MTKNFNINIPNNIKIILWKKDNVTKINLIGDNKFLELIFIKNSVKIDKWTNSIIIYNENCLLESENAQKKIYDFLKSWDIFIFNKIKFKGKGFRIKFFKKIKLIKFYFGRSHKTFVFLKGLFKKKLSKYKFILYGIKKVNILNSSKIIVNIKPLNLYTLRGLRNNRQIIFKRKGKKGTYI